MRYLCLIAIVLVTAGCAAQPAEESAVFVSVPLEFDPTERYELAAWWSNGNQLLNLDATGYYALYGDANRFRSPQERGRWWKHSYAALWLEPYDELEREQTRVSIRKVEGELELHVRSLAPLKPLTQGPPEVVEDRLIGFWSGDQGTLQLRSDLRYVFQPQPQPAGPPAPASIGRHQGSWRVRGETLRLWPDSPSMTPIELALEQADESLVLAAGDGNFRQRKQ